MARSETGHPATRCPLGRTGPIGPLEERERRVTFARMKGRPFGFDTAGEPIAQVSGNMVRAAVDTLGDVVEESARREMAPGATEFERDAVAVTARAEAVASLVSRLNGTIADPAYHVTAGMLREEGRRFSREFELFVNVFCEELSGEPGFYWRRGARTVPTALATLFRPFSIRRVYEMAPRATSRFLDTDIRVVGAGAESAVLQWYGHKQRDGLPPELRTEWLEMSCPAFCGAYSSIPARMGAGAPADVETRRCQRQGSECCEWLFTWANPRPRPGPGAWLGIAASLTLLAATWTRLPGHELFAIAALLPTAAAWHAWRVRALEWERARRDETLSQLRTVAEELHIERDAAQLQAQLAGIEEARRAAWLTAFEEIGRTVRSATSGDEVLTAGLAALVAHRVFDRGFTMLVNAERGLLAGGPSAGGSPEAAARIRQLRQPLDESDSPLVAVYEAKETLVLPGDAVRDTPFGRFWMTLATRELAGVPLTVGGRTVGILIADTSHTGRPITELDARLLLRAGSLLAAGVEQARLHTQLEVERTHPGA